MLLHANANPDNQSLDTILLYSSRDRNKPPILKITTAIKTFTRKKTSLTPFFLFLSSKRIFTDKMMIRLPEEIHI